MDKIAFFCTHTVVVSSSFLSSPFKKKTKKLVHMHFKSKRKKKEKK